MLKMYLFLVKMFALVWHARAAWHDLPLLSCKYSHPLGNSGWKQLHGGKPNSCDVSCRIIMDPNCHNMPDALQHARCQIHNGIYNCNLFNFEKHPAVQSLTCGKVLATNLSSQWICLNFLSVSSSLFFTRQDKFTISPFQCVQFLFFCQTNGLATENKLPMKMIAKSIITAEWEWSLFFDKSIH